MRQDDMEDSITTTKCPHDKLVMLGVYIKCDSCGNMWAAKLGTSIFMNVKKGGM